MGGAGIVFKDFSFGFVSGGKVTWIIRNASGRIDPGYFYLVTGPSGTGKSTFLKLVAGHIDPLDTRWVTKGRLRVFKDGRGKARVVSILQDEGLWADKSVLENISFCTKGDEEKARELLSAVGITDPPERVMELSGGERKRVALARAIAAWPDILVLDETTAGLDRNTELRILNVLKEYHASAKRPVTILLCSHGVEGAKRIAEKEISLPGDGSIHVKDVQGGYTDGEFRHPTGRRPVYHVFLGLPLGTARMCRSLLEACAALPVYKPVASVADAAERILGMALYMAVSGFMIGALSLHFLVGSNPLQDTVYSLVFAGAGRTVVAIVVPVFATLLFAAPAVSGTMSSIGTMKRTGELSAYKALGRPVTREVLSPLLWSLSVSLPVLVSIASVSAFFGAWASQWLERSMSFSSFLPVFSSGITGRDIGFLVLKSLCSGFVLTWIPWHFATSRDLGPKDLGRNAVLAWTWSSLLVILLHGALLFPQLEA